MKSLVFISFSDTAIKCQNKKKLQAWAFDPRTLQNYRVAKHVKIGPEDQTFEIRLQEREQTLVSTYVSFRLSVKYASHEEREKHTGERIMAGDVMSCHVIRYFYKKLRNSNLILRVWHEKGKKDKYLHSKNRVVC